jgi:hypothetical protein
MLWTEIGNEKKKAMKLKVFETILRTTKFEQMDALHQHIFTQAEYVSKRYSSLFIPFDCSTYVERSRARAHTHTHTHTQCLYTRYLDNPNIITAVG